MIMKAQVVIGNDRSNERLARRLGLAAELGTRTSAAFTQFLDRSPPNGGWPA
jgi:hypothetical protein